MEHDPLRAYIKNVIDTSTDRDTIQMGSALLSLLSLAENTHRTQMPTAWVRIDIARFLGRVHD